jgi:hypothetical protein
MYHLQIITREAVDVQAEVMSAIRDERMRSFEIDRIRGGLVLRHKKFRGDVRFLKTPGPLMITVRGPDEWQLLDAFIGRLVYHFADTIRGINIQLDAAPPVAKKGVRQRTRRAAGRRAGRRAAVRKAKRAPRRPAKRAARTPGRRATRRATRRVTRRLTRRTSRRGRAPRRSR